MAKTVIKDTRLQKYVGATLLVILKDHPFYHCIGIGESFDELATGGYGLLVKYEGGETGFILSASEVKIIDDEKDKLITTEDIIEQLAGCNYGPKQIAMYLELPEKDFLAAWNDSGSKVRFHYDKGRLTADFDVNQKLLHNAKTGNITAAQIFFKNSEAKTAEDLKAKLFNGFETGGY